MIFQKQLFRHDPENGVMGDCYRTAIACLLDVGAASVPHFMSDPDEPIRQIWERVDRWLHQNFGLRYVSIPYPGDDLKPLLRAWRDTWPGIRAELAGKSPRGTQHSVIVENGKIIWDPHPDGGGIVAPGEDGYFWLGFLLPVAIHGERKPPSRPMTRSARNG